MIRLDAMYSVLLVCGNQFDMLIRGISKNSLSFLPLFALNSTFLGNKVGLKREKLEARLSKTHQMIIRGVIAESRTIIDDFSDHRRKSR